MKKFYLLPGKMYASNEPTEVSTILGSCVAVALFDASTGIGGLNHFLLPGGEAAEFQTARYGHFAIHELIQQMKSFGARVGSLKAKIYGGASVLGEVSENLDVGKRNVELAKSLLAHLNIEIVDQQTGGKQGCRVQLKTDSFEVQHRFFGDDEITPDTSGFGKAKLKRQCRVLIVDDSATVRALFDKIFRQHGLDVVGLAANAFDAREMIARMKPDVMTLDIEMPMMSGVAFLEKVMKHLPIPTVMVSSLGSNGEAALKALQLGAIEFVQKPSQYDIGELQRLGESLVEKVRAAANQCVTKIQSVESPVTPQPSKLAGKKWKANLALIAVSGNSGCSASLEKLFASLPSDTPPVAIACSTVTLLLEDFLQDLRKRHRQISFETAKEGLALRPGSVYFGPAGKHTQVQMLGGRLSFSLLAGHPVNSQLPSGTLLFESVAKAAAGCSVGILLSGFGSDGIEGLSAMQSAGCVTIAEDPKTLSFPFAPQGAIAQGVVDEIYAAENLASAILTIRNRGVA